jgi:lipopolysaccharide export LptBFGC system permease protein LptF
LPRLRQRHLKARALPLTTLLSAGDNPDLTNRQREAFSYEAHRRLSQATLPLALAGVAAAVLVPSQNGRRGLYGRLALMFGVALVVIGGWLGLAGAAQDEPWLLPLLHAWAWLPCLIAVGALIWSALAPLEQIHSKRLSFE